LEAGRNPRFCAEWNPDFTYQGYRCCPKKTGSSRLRAGWCSPQRRKTHYCNEMTPAQKHYIDEISSEKRGDLLSLIRQEIGKKGVQSNCEVTDGFLAWGRPLVATSLNHILLRAPQKCLYFGTDEMIAMMEWLGREVGSQYSTPEFSGVRLLVGDISAPRGGCLSGRGGRRGHRSHTSGRDVDIGFLIAKKGVKSPGSFQRQFDAKTNWWLLKKLFSNPFVCIQSIFLDQKLIRSLSKIASIDQDWIIYRRFIRHVRGHRNHFHVRIGQHPGEAGCKEEEEIYFEDEEEIEAEEGAFLYPELNWEPTRGSASLLHP
jgi:murein endopeptidase